MQMNDLRSANFTKLSSSNSTSDEYWVRSMSAGTPGGYCLSQIRSMGLSPREFAVFVLCTPRQEAGALVFRSIGNAARYGKRLRVIDALVRQAQSRLMAAGPAQNPGQGVCDQPAGLASGLGFAVVFGLVAVAVAGFAVAA